MRIALVLDTAAILAYADDEPTMAAFAVGEMLDWTADEPGTYVGLPMLALADARRHLNTGKQRGHLRDLMETLAIPLGWLPEPADAIRLGVRARALGDLVLAHVALTARSHDAQILSAHGDLLRGAYPGLTVHDLF